MLNRSNLGSIGGILNDSKLLKMFKLFAELPVAVFLCSSCKHFEALLRKTFLTLQQGLPREPQRKIFRRHESGTMRTRRS